MNLASTCGKLIMGGLPGTSVSPELARALRDGRRGGVILFKPNVEGGPAQVASLTREVWSQSADSPLIGIDQEGGRVARLRAPWLTVPPMATVASWGDVDLARRIAAAVARELGAVGITVNFAPVLDTNTCPTNPVIGDRAFGTQAEVVERFGVPWLLGLQDAGLLACGKHFPGHGDTTKDSHVDLPVVDQPLDRLERVEMAPFRAAAAAGVAALMTAHVVYTALDRDRPATLSPAACTGARDRIGFDGLLVSDDLEMQAIAARWSIEEAAVQAVVAGCDLLLVCWSEEKQERALRALVHEAERSTAFLARCRQACARTAIARRRIASSPLGDDGARSVVGGVESRALEAEIARRTAL
jgi:beta-N-acetylhexosaminidase